MDYSSKVYFRSSAKNGHWPRVQPDKCLLEKGSSKYKEPISSVLFVLTKLRKKTKRTENPGTWWFCIEIETEKKTGS